MRTARDREALAQLGLPGATSFFDAVARPHEDYELGIAAGRGTLVSYNPRTRQGDFRERVLHALRQAQLPTGPVEQVFASLGPQDCSTVLGLEWMDEGVQATVYVEELERFLPHPLAWLREHVGEVPGSSGAPYILAVDLPSGAWKVYFLHHQAPGLVQHPLEAPGAAAWIEQRRVSTGTLKLYRCFDYRNGQPPDVPVHVPALPWDDVRVTSVGQRFGDEGGETVYMSVR